MQQDKTHSITSQDMQSWDTVKDQLLKTYGEKIFILWFKKIYILGVENNTVLLGVKTKFIRDWILNNYFDVISKLCKEHFNNMQKVELNTVTHIPTINADEESIKKSTLISPKNIVSNTLDKRFMFDNFVVGPPNQLAYTAARAISEATSAVPESNPLFLYGGVGLGKTHLMQSIAWHTLFHNKNRKFIYISAEKFMYNFVQSLRKNSLLAFKEQFRSVDILMIDDIQFICGKDSTQEEFFHTFNALIDNRRQMVISCDRSPSDLDNIEERIKSRLGWGLVADVHSTTYELRIGILESKLEQMKISIPKTVVEFLASKVTSNVRELEGSLNKIIAHSKLTHTPINLNTTSNLLKDLIKANEIVIDIDVLKKKICKHYGIRMADMMSNSRSRSISQPRQLAMYLAKLLTPKSLAEIGKHFGHKDHTTVMHAIKKIENLCKQDLEFKNEVEIGRAHV